MQNLTDSPRSPQTYSLEVYPTHAHPHVHPMLHHFHLAFKHSPAEFHPIFTSNSFLNFRFGDCFGRNTRESRAPWGTTGEISHHKFYLAFENSIHCNDYISEKFWRNALSSGAVPVVYGLGFEKFL